MTTSLHTVLVSWNIPQKKYVRLCQKLMKIPVYAMQKNCDTQLHTLCAQQWSIPLSYIYLEKSRLKKKQEFRSFTLCCGSVYPNILRAHHSFKVWGTNQPMTQNHIPEIRILKNNYSRTTLRTRHNVTLSVTVPTNVPSP